MQFKKTSLNDVWILEPRVFGDERGFFMETFRADKFAEVTGVSDFVQDNHSLSSKCILRGLHYQTKQTQGKLVRVVRGALFDVVVDLRENSSTFGQWLGVDLTAENKRMLWVPKGFAHGFYVTSDQTECLYKCTDYYHPGSEVSIAWNDPKLAIKWPFTSEKSQGENPVLSDKDKNGIAFSEAPKFPG